MLLLVLSLSPYATKVEGRENGREGAKGRDGQRKPTAGG